LAVNPQPKARSITGNSQAIEAGYTKAINTLIVMVALEELKPVDLGELTAYQKPSYINIIAVKKDCYAT
jgi:hypothetical protein